MKTSNHLIIALLAILFMIPVIAAINLKAKVDKKEFVVKDFFGKRFDFLPLQPFKVVEVDGTNSLGLISVDLIFADTVGYQIEDLWQDDNINKRLQISNNGDTLFLKRIDQVNKEISENNTKSTNYIRPLIVYLKVPKNVSVITKNSNVKINNFSSDMSSDTIYLKLYNASFLNINSGISKNLDSDVDLDSIPSISTKLPNFIIDCNNSSVDMGGKIWIPNFSIQTQKNSDISVGKHVTIDNLKINLSNATILNAPYNFLKRVK